MTDASPAHAQDSSGAAPTAVVFDIGEVLIDESRLWEAWAGLVGISPLTFAAVLGASISQGGDHHEAFAHVAPNVDWRQLAEEHERIFQGIQAIDLYPDARACMASLREQGVRVGVAGNQPAMRQAQLDALDLPCDFIMTSEELGVEKPERAFFEAVVDRVDVDGADHVLYVGDRVDNDVIAAYDAGLRTCWLRRGPWGLLQDLPDDVVPDIVLEGLGELPEIVKDWREH